MIILAGKLLVLSHMTWLENWEDLEGVGTGRTEEAFLHGKVPPEPREDHDPSNLPCTCLT